MTGMSPLFWCFWPGQFLYNLVLQNWSLLIQGNVNDRLKEQFRERFLTLGIASGVTLKIRLANHRPEWKKEILTEERFYVLRSLFLLP